jgi:MFS family permease
MRDLGFRPVPRGRPVAEVRRVLRESVSGGLGNPPVRWLMLQAPFSMGVGIYVFYAMQPYLLERYGDERAFGVAGLAAAVVAGAQMLGGLAVPLVRRAVGRRTTALLAGAALGVGVLVLLGRTERFSTALALLVVWALVSAAVSPVRQAFLNGAIPSGQRATVLSFDSLMGSAGGVVAQPALGRVADVHGYGASYVVAAGISALALPFLWLARRERTAVDVVQPRDPVVQDPTPVVPPEADALADGT